MKNLGTIIKEKREEKNISIRELAKIIKTDYSGLSKIENGKTKKPSPEILFNLCKELDLNFLNLLKTAGYTNIEILNITNIGMNLFVSVKAISILGKDKLEKYCVDKEEGTFLDIKKILENYKKGNIDIYETIELINSCEPIILNDKIIYPSYDKDIILEIDDNL